MIGNKKMEQTYIQYPNLKDPLKIFFDIFQTTNAQVNHTQKKNFKRYSIRNQKSITLEAKTIFI